MLNADKGHMDRLVLGFRAWEHQQINVLPSMCCILSES